MLVCIHKHLGDLHPLAARWDALLEKSVRPSIFLTYDYLTTAWKQFHRTSSQPYVIVVEDDNRRVIGIGPFRLARRSFAGIPVRVIRYLSTWEVDKPYIIAKPEDEETVWRLILDCLRQHSSEWDKIELMELPEEALGREFLAGTFHGQTLGRAASSRKEGPIINLDQDWAEFKRRHRSLKKISRLKRLPHPYRILTFDRPDNIRAGLAGYARVEDLSWKGDENLTGVDKDARHRGFYEELLPLLAAKKRVAVRVLVSGRIPVAADITYTFGQWAFFHHAAYNNEFRRLSVGRLFTGLVLKEYFARPEKFGDFLCGYADYMRPWADELITVSDLVAFNTNLRGSVLHLAIGMANRVRDLTSVLGSRLTRLTRPG